MLRRGVFTSVAQLERATLDWAAHWTSHPKPFVWKAPEDNIAAASAAGSIDRQVSTKTDHEELESAAARVGQATGT